MVFYHAVIYIIIDKKSVGVDVCGNY